MFRQNSNIKSGYVSDKILILSLAMFQTNSNRNSNIKIDSVSDKILILSLAMFQTKY